MIFRFDGCKPSFTCPSLEDAIPNLTPWEAIRAGEAQPGWYKMLNRNPYFSFGGEHSISKPYPFHHVRISGTKSGPCAIYGGFGSFGLEVDFGPQKFDGETGHVLWKRPAGITPMT